MSIFSQYAAIIHYFFQKLNIQEYPLALYSDVNLVIL